MSNATQMPDYWALEFLQLNDMAIGLRDRLEKADAENAKLRELVGIVFGRLQAAEDATDMGWIDARLLDRMRELGVEVDDASVE